ncbi:MAG: hypothetical protein IJ368_06180 [Oscillospiraceae bacterium]|nr:hypothetical protein [Oscillospiraceae bacterium]
MSSLFDFFAAVLRITGFIIIGAIILVAVVFLVCIASFLYSKKPYISAKNYYRDNSAAFEALREYMGSVYSEGVLWARLEDGQLKICTEEGGETSQPADEKAMAHLEYLHGRYARRGYPKTKPEEYNYNFRYVLAEFDDSGNMTMTVQVWHKALDPKDKYEDPDKIRYWLRYCDICRRDGRCNSRDCGDAFEEGWCVVSKRGYAG